MSFNALFVIGFKLRPVIAFTWVSDAKTVLNQKEIFELLPAFTRVM